MQYLYLYMISPGWVFLSLSKPILPRAIQHSPLTYKAQNRMYKRYSPLTLHTASLPGWGRYYVYKECSESRDFSKAYSAVFRQLPVLAAGQRGRCFALDQRQFLLFKHIHKTNSTTLNALARSRLALPGISHRFCVCVCVLH